MKNLPLRIVVVDKGFVFIGYFEETNMQIVVHNAHCIRQWGTNKGLGQLALHGPMPQTKLDAYGIVRLPYHSYICSLDVDTEQWKNIYR